MIKENKPTMELMTITPSRAEAFLRLNKLNRSVSQHKVDEYASEMKNNQWKLTHQGISFYENNSIADGQHRLLAIIKANKPIQAFVTYGLKQESGLAIDRGRPRSVVDNIKISGASDWITSKHIGLINQIAYPKRLPSSQIISNLDLIKQSALFAVNHISHKRFLSNASMHGAVAIAHHNGVDESRLIKFCEVYISGIAENKGDISAIKCRDDFLVQRSGSGTVRHELYLKAQKCIHSFLRYETIARLKVPKEAIWTLTTEEV